MQNLEVKIYVV